METRRDVFQAIADPTRRAIVGLLAERPMNLNAIAENFDTTRQAVSLHIRVLEECGLLRIRKEGRERVCEAKLRPLHDVSKWVEKYRPHFESKLDSLETYLDTIQKKKAHAKSGK